MVLKDAEENGEPCLECGQLNNREKGSHSPGHADQEKNWAERGIFCQLHSQLFSLQLYLRTGQAVCRANASSHPLKLTHFLITEKCNRHTDSALQANAALVSGLPAGGCLLQG